jgi:two-component system, OmpR family, sensor kinase
VKRAWDRLGLRGRLGISIAAIVVIAFGVVFVAVRAQMAHESHVIGHEESREDTSSPPPRGQSDDDSRLSPIRDAQSDVEKTFLLVGGATLIAALLAGYLVAARTASPLRRFAATAAQVDAGDLSPRLESDVSMAAELRTLAESFNHMLDRLDQAFARQRQFVSNASHELRSPLTAIRGQIEVLARNDSPSPDEVRRVEEMTMIEMRRAERLVDDLLALARLDEGGIGPALQAVACGAYLRGFADGATGAIEIGDLAEGTVRIDPDLTAQVVRNLLGNARRYAGPDGRVAISATQDGRGSLVVSIDDDGPGVPPEQRDRVFGRFHRTQASRDRASGGSGLGLGIARSIVELQGGRIWFEDSPLGGARVSFELPGFRSA